MSNAKHRPFRSRIGRFVVSKLFVEEYPETVLRLMATVIPIRAEMLYHRNEFEYIALSPHFEELVEGQMYPTYCATISADGVEWRKS